jgi:hypothetical protein
VQHDRSQRAGTPAIEQGIEELLQEFMLPQTLVVADILRRDGLRQRTLTLPIMMGLVLTMIWRQIGSVREMARTLQREVVLWLPQKKISHQAINERLRTMPANAFQRVFEDVLPEMHARWAKRDRPLPDVMAWACKQFSEILICDGSTLDSLIRKTGLLKDEEKHPLAGRIMGLLNMASKLPIWIGFTDNEDASDQSFWREILARVKTGALLVFDLGFVNFARYLEMTRAGITFATRAKDNLSYELDRVIAHLAELHDEVVWIGQAETRQRVRLIRFLFRGKWYRYITNELDPLVFPAERVVQIYRSRWRIEEAFNVAKSLLGLSYFYCGSLNAIQLQVWATWILYTTLVDLTDAVAQALNKPFADISMEMIYRSIHFFVKARHAGTAHDIVKYFADPGNKDLGIVKYRPKPKPPSTRQTAWEDVEFGLT